MGQSKRILVVDDLPSARKVVTRLLNRMGFSDVVEARDGQAAIEAATLSTFDLIISDWHMPKLDGLELFRKIKELPSTKSTKFLFVTSSNQKEEVLSAVTAGVRDYLCKPFSAEALEDKLKTIL